MPRKRYNVVMATEQGSYIVNKNDLGVGAQLSANGAYDPDEIALFRGLVGSLGRKDAVVLDIGANIGIHAVSLEQDQAGRTTLSLHPEQGPGADIGVDERITHLIAGLLQKTAITAQWQITLAPLTPPAMGESASIRVH